MVQDKPSFAAPVGQTPLRRFRGVLDNWEKVQREYEGRKYEVVTFNFASLEVLETDEVYPFPIAQLTITYAPPTQSRGKTAWDALGSSIRKLTPDPDIDALKGKMQEWAQLPATLRKALVDEDGTPQLDGNGRPVFGDQEGEAWQIVAVDGLGNTEEADAAFTAYLVGVADGKVERAFYEALLTDGKVTARPDVVTAITDRKLLDALLLTKQLTRDEEGVLHKV